MTVRDSLLSTLEAMCVFCDSISELLIFSTELCYNKIGRGDHTVHHR